LSIDVKKVKTLLVTMSRVDKRVSFALQPHNQSLSVKYGG